eukprot:13575215-Alexandrium_andersonii.AAC.1
MSASLVGSEMCIRDRGSPILGSNFRGRENSIPGASPAHSLSMLSPCGGCLLYTSDAADDM